MFHIHCNTCGRPGVRHICGACMEVATDCQRLGVAIQRFVRRTEVARLRALLSQQCYLASLHTTSGEANGAAAEKALERLASLALEGDER